MLTRFNRRKRAVTGRWHVDETYIKVRGQWIYLYGAIDSGGCPFPANGVTCRFYRKALDRHGRPGGDRFLRFQKSLHDRSRRQLKPI
ncbi:MAG: IS6 family transposase [Mesorhizobium sp.]|nr:MAG: IS6 family transposase [Mesorhizobium sp.]TIM18788.1 MAG: IS6 family transposase [Mesorhizobium sp.]